jgi:5-methylcytosine-specific restriction endonuclease McrA
MMQKQVFERDNYTCQLCGVRGVDLQVDHIQSWAEYVELRFSMDNCRTLCSKCHYKITFGRPMPETILGWGHNILKARIEP